MVAFIPGQQLFLVVKIQTFFKLWRALISNLGVKRDTTRIKIPVAILMFFKKTCRKSQRQCVEVSFLTQTMA
jgi:hypothetical protein